MPNKNFFSKKYNLSSLVYNMYMSNNVSPKSAKLFSSRELFSSRAFLPCIVHILLKKNDTFLFLKRSNTNYYDGTWCLPSGKVEKHESPLQAARRELLEEVNIQVDSIKCASVLYLVVPEPDVPKELYEYLAFFFYAETDDTPINNEPDKHSEIAWFSLDNLPDSNLIMPGTQHGINCYKNGIAFDEIYY